MKLCTYQSGDRPRVGVVTHDTIYDLASTTPGVAVGDEILDSPDPLKALLAAEPEWRRVRDHLAEQDGEHGRPVGSLTDRPLLPPVVRPDKFICIGLNFRSHALEAAIPIPEIPTFFVKLPNALIGHRRDVPIPRVSHRIDWEGEVAFVISRRASEVGEDEALQHVAGYTIVNDVTARDYQFKTSQWIVGKTFDGFGPVGPVISTPDELPDPHTLKLTTQVNGVVQQEGSSDDFVFTIAQLVSFLSSIMTLEPGDIVATGTPAGIGALQKPRRWLRNGDTVDVTVAGVGTLTNTIRSLG